MLLRLQKKSAFAPERRVAAKSEASYPRRELQGTQFRDCAAKGPNLLVASCLLMGSGWPFIFVRPRIGWRVRASST
jgi:hypothetical protein